MKILKFEFLYIPFGDLWYIVSIKLFFFKNASEINCFFYKNPDFSENLVYS
ncbi:hypothetical protein LEP1GSC070_3615 [Leptospira santarosai str. AIM]|nr:hypothetical protein LEP1GSC070_3615 [Leptospira santarosai str. AIM]EPG81418.1 hypothetical protein LEP1GSC048_2014 [Leptospira santarosai serovar Shermani str. 1342KT]